MKRISIELTVVLSLVSLALLVGPASAVVHQVTAQGTTFDPAAVSIAEGDTVRWVHVSGSHTVTSGIPCSSDGLFSASLNAANPVFEYVFNTAGNFPYFCIPHCSFGMTAEVQVLPDVSAVPDEGVDEVTGSLPAITASPNPFGRSTQLRFALAEPEHVLINVFDAQGRPVATLSDRLFNPGPHTVTWNGRTGTGAPAPSGIYYAKRLSSRGPASSTLILVR